MSIAPDYSRQTAEPMTEQERMKWIRSAKKEARAQGCTWIEAVWDNEAGSITVEGWETMPA